MTKTMTQNAFLFFFMGLLPLTSFATVDSPVVQGLGGASRAGVPREAIFANPASVANISSTFGFFHYQIPSVPDFNAGGRGLSVGLYDGGNDHWKGGFGFSRTAKARISNNQQGYVDRSEFRFSTAHALFGEVVGGVATRRISIDSGLDSSKFFEGDLGLLFPVFTDIRGGLTFENVLNKEDEAPQTLGAGAAYSLGYGFLFVADGYRLLSGTKKGERGWALATEVLAATDFTIRASLFEEAYRRLKGWSLGGTWAGPRASFDYAFKVVGKGPKEKNHILGITTIF